MKRILIATILFGMMLFAACAKKDSGVKITVSDQKPINTAPPAADAWLGRWPGVEGTYLDLAKQNDMYVVTVANLDGPSTYQATSAGDHIEFVRNGKTEMIRAGNGEDTGMKWLLNKKNCLVINKGSEGFCRD